MDSFSVSSSVLLDSELDLVFAVFDNHSLSPSPANPRILHTVGTQQIFVGDGGAGGGGQGRGKKDNNKQHSG